MSRAVKVSQPHANKDPNGKPFYKDCASVVMPDEVYEALLKSGGNLTVFPNFIPDGVWTGRAWADDGETKKPKW